jgi:hypothetical protein
MAILDKSGAPVLRIAICIPCTDTLNSGFALDLARLTYVLGEAGIQTTLIQNRGTIIPQQRAVLVRAAMHWTATHILWLDSDMRFPPNVLHRLVQHHEPIVAVNYARRREPYLPTAEHRELGLLFTTEDSEGLVEVTQCGMGIMLVDMQVYHAMQQPWFAIGFNPRDNEYTGEDFFFCKKAREAGFVTLIDQDLSKEIKHVGEMSFTAEHTVVTRDAYHSQEMANVA